ncbi:hypothetical protein FLGE108171_01300 [Flavobacterium gelidilacus]|jgi:hypothetical protein|uniref:hypothetical protein n=1 Tax=Flavobacterium gelidilacus TaxID=206041 RepID=UPI000424ED3E|nr:hypothetical protein [Flavobacterium gelidilacus]
MKKEDFIENILNSTNGITKVNPNEDLLSKIQAKLEDEKPAESYTKWLVAASILILVSLNIGILANTKQKSNQNHELSDLVKTTDNQLY